MSDGMYFLKPNGIGGFDHFQQDEVTGEFKPVASPVWDRARIENALANNVILPDTVYAVFYCEHDTPLTMIGICSSVDRAKARAESHWNKTHETALKWWQPDIGLEHVGEPVLRYEIPHTVPTQYLIHPYKVDE